MRSLGLALSAALLLACVVLLSWSPEDSSSSSSLSGEEAWSSRSLLALGPIREQIKGLHRHGRVEYRYQQVKCDESTSSTVSTRTSTTVPPTTTVTVPTVPTVPVTTVVPLTTLPATTLPSTTTSPCPTCPPPTNVCTPLACACFDNLCSCRPFPVNCTDNNPCTTDSCVEVLLPNGTKVPSCQHVYNPDIPGCSCVGFNCPSNGCFPAVCQIVNSRPACVSLTPRNCSDNNNCTDDICTVDPFNVSFANCSNVFNATLCPAGTGLPPGTIVGIVIGAVAAAAIAAALAAWARRSPNAAPGTASATTTPLATASPLYSEPINAGVMPAV